MLPIVETLLTTFFYQEKQIISTARTAEEGLKEFAVGEDTHCWSELDQQPNFGENQKAAADGDRTIPKLIDRSHGDLKSGKVS